MLTALYVQLYTAWLAVDLPHRREERGQASAEYALVLLGAAAVALLVTAWATKTGKVGKLLDTVLDKLLDRVK
jgi:Flp pilus assembly pilin Flp